MKKILYTFFIINFIAFSASFDGKYIAKGEKISINYKKADLLDVIRSISRLYNLNIVAGNDIKGEVTLSLNDVNLDEALEVILSLNNYTYIETKGIVRIISIEKAEKEYNNIKKINTKKDEERIYKIFKLTSMNAESIKEKLDLFISKESKLAFEKDNNCLILLGTKEEINLIETMLKDIDIKKDNENRIEEYTEFIETYYRNVSEIYELIKEFNYDKNVELKLKSDIKGLIFKGKKEEIEKIKKFIKNYDKAPLQVTIEAKIVEMGVGNDRTSGVNIKSKVQNENISGVLDLASGVAGGLNLSLGVLDYDNYEITYTNIMENDKSNLLSSPTITTLNGKKASIHIGDKIPYQESSSSNTSDTQQISYKFEEVGIKLEVTPVIKEDGYINLEISPEVSSATNYTADNVPIISTRDASTNVLIKDGYTLAIGGLVREEFVSTERAVPLLSKIPLLGHFFRSEKKVKQKTNLIIFISPKIIKPEDFENNTAKGYLNKEYDDMISKINELERKTNREDLVLSEKKNLIKLYEKLNQEDKIINEVVNLKSAGISDDEINKIYKKYF